MNILTIITKRSVREPVKSDKLKQVYSTLEYEPGTVFEIIDANKKAPAIVVKKEKAQDHKQAIRDGSMKVSRLVLSKTGPYKMGIPMHSYSLQLIKECVKNSECAQKSGDAFLKKFFPIPRKTKKITTKPRATIDGTLSTLSLSRYQTGDKTHSTELQLFVDEARTYFGEKARYGQGSFSYYIGFAKKVPTQELWQMFGEAKQARGKTRFEQKKIFWWKIGQYLKKD